MKKIWITMGCVLTVIVFITSGLLLCLTGCAAEKSTESETSKPHQEPSVTNSFADRILPDSADDLLEFTEWIIVGEFVGETEERKFNMYGIGEAAEELAAAALANGNDPYMTARVSKIRVEETICGNLLEDSKIELFEIGIPGMTNVQKGQQLILLLRHSDTEGTYYAANGEESIFYLNEDDTITPMSDEPNYCQYAGVSKDALITALQNGMITKSEQQAE